MSGPSEDTVCRDVSRRTIYDRISRSLLKEETFAKGTCSICGADGVEVNRDGRCRAQTALTAKRPGAAEGHALAFGSPVGGGRYSMVDDKAALLVEPAYATFTGKILPTAPLPEHAELRPDLDVVDLLDRIVTNPTVPFILGTFRKKADMDLKPSRDVATIVLNGTQPPVQLDRARLVTLIALVEAFGPDLVDVASRYRTRSGAANLASARKEEARLRREAPGLLARIREAPFPGEAEYEHARKIAQRRVRRATANS